MRTNIDIDDELLRRVMQGYGYRTKKEAIHAGLRKLADIEGQKEILKLRGKLKWEGDLHASRLNRFEDRGE